MARPTRRAAPVTKATGRDGFFMVAEWSEEAGDSSLSRHMAGNGGAEFGENLLIERTLELDDQPGQLRRLDPFPSLELGMGDGLGPDVRISARKSQQEPLHPLAA